MSQEQQHSTFLAKLRAKRDNGSSPQPHPAPAEPVPPLQGALPGLVNPPEPEATNLDESEAEAPPAGGNGVDQGPRRRGRPPKAETEARRAAEAAASTATASRAEVGTTSAAVSVIREKLAHAGLAGSVPAPSIADLTAQFAAGFEAGFAAGRKAGFAAGRKAGQE